MSKKKRLAKRAQVSKEQQLELIEAILCGGVYTKIVGAALRKEVLATKSHLRWFSDEFMFSLLSNDSVSLSIIPPRWPTFLRLVGYATYETTSDAPICFLVFVREGIGLMGGAYYRFIK